MTWARPMRMTDFAMWDWGTLSHGVLGKGLVLFRYGEVYGRGLWRDEHFGRKSCCKGQEVHLTATLTRHLYGLRFVSEDLVFCLRRSCVLSQKILRFVSEDHAFCLQKILRFVFKNLAFCLGSTAFCLQRSCVLPQKHRILSTLQDLTFCLRNTTFCLQRLRFALEELRFVFKDHAFCLGSTVFFTTHYLAKEREAASAKPHHMIASSNSRISSKNMTRFSSNDMIHNHYLEEAKKRTQERSRNSEHNLVPFARLQSIANGSKPMPRRNTQPSRNWPASKNSFVTTKTVPIAEHSRNSWNFSDSKHFVCSTCQKCFFSANHDSCVTKFLKEMLITPDALILTKALLEEYNLVSWMSKKKNCTAMSSAEAENVALSTSYAQVM
nr:hypothetical protein [Tanacetum cinerariifolium]